jgi:Bacterial cellulose synthase subunit
VLLGLAIAPAAPAAAVDAPVAVAQEVTLDGLGIGSQTVYGAHGAVEVTFPAAATDLFQTDNFVRVFFSHSVDVLAGSSMLIAIDGQPLLTVPLGPGTAAGGVVETRIPSALLAPRQSHRLQVRFTLNGPAATLYGRIDGQTTMHYQLAPSPAGLPELEVYPYSLLAAGASNPPLGLVLPSGPSTRDLAAAFRVLGDLGRRAASQHVRPVVVTAEQTAWLAAGGVSAVLVGSLAGLPAAPPILEASGWKQSAGGWTAPDGRALGSDQGLVLAAISPWDHRTPLLLVTGGTPAAVDRAAAALVSGGGALAGQYVIVSSASATEATGPPRAVQVSVLSPRDLASFGAGRYRATVGFAAPPVDPGDTAVMELAVPALGSAVSSASVEADINGSWVAATDLDSSGARSSRLVASFPGRLLRPGRNSLSLEFHIASRAGSTAGVDGPFTTGGADTATAGLSLPDPLPTAGDLRLLPFPFLEAGRPLEMVLADGASSTLAAAAQAMLALGSRSTQAPPSLDVGFASGWDGAGDEDILVVGRPPANSALEALGARLPVVFEQTGDVSMGGRSSGGRVRITSSVGAVEEVRTSDAAGRQVLWLSGTGPDVLSGAAVALYDPSLSGTAALVDARGHLSAVGGGSGVFSAFGPSTAQVAGGAAALLILAVVGLQLLRPRRTSP